MSEEIPCPLKMDTDGGECGGTLNVLFDGSGYCPKCDNRFGPYNQLGTERTEKYDPCVQDLIEADFQTVYDEYVRLLDMYYKGKVGFPTPESHKRFQTVMPLLLPMYIVHIQEQMKVRNQKLKHELRKASRRP